MKNVIMKLLVLSFMTSSIALADNYGMRQMYPTVNEQINNPPAHNYGMTDVESY